MGLMDLLQQAAGMLGSNPEQHFDQVAQQAPADVVGKGLADAFKSDQTPPFAQMVAQLFANSTPEQRATMLNQLLATVGSGALTQAAGGALGNVLAPGASQVTGEQASQLTPEQVQQIAAHAEQSHPGVIDQLGNFYAQHPTLVKTLGGAALAIVLAKMKDHLQG